MQEIKHIALAELKELKLIKEVSGDLVIKVTFVSEDTKLLELGKYQADTLFRLIIEADNLR